ncbi:MAG: DNA polymerase [Patescibacteria group bacterium]|nr:DNA polymerase [Patescibacteria group bacterium]
MKNNEKIVLLDAYAIIHRAYHALPDFSSQKGEPTGALYGISAMLLKIIKDLKPDYIIACYDLPEPTYRHEIYDEYKAGREKPDDDLIKQIDRSRDLFKVFNIPIYEKAGFEADDILGTIVEKLKEKDIDIVIASGDMDTLQLVAGNKVRVYTLKKGINNTILYNEKAVIERFGFKPKLLVDYKGLRGDPSDNIIGVKGVGEKTATILIQNFKNIENIYKQLKEDENILLDKGIKPRIIGLLEENEEEAFFSKELATIRRDVPIKFSLPNKKWKENVDSKKIISLFQEFGFRTLTQRVRDFFRNDLEGYDEEVLKKIDKPEEKINEAELEKVLIALWLLDSNITKPTIEDILDFSGKDTFVEAKKFVWEMVKDKKLEFILKEVEIPLIPVIKKMSETGIRVNIKYLAEMSKEYHSELDKLKVSIWKYAGEEFNINSPKQLAEILFEGLSLKTSSKKKTPAGKRTTKESELKKMIGVHPIIKDVLKYRELQKLLSTYIDNLPDLVDKKGRIHATFLQAGTTTGRLSSSNPNMQNIPTRTEHGKKIRGAFESEKGFDLIAFDYSQVELRVVAVLSGDKNLVDIFKNDDDVHSAVASKIFRVPLDKVNSAMRRKAKVVNFGMIYGMGVNSLRQNMEDASGGVEKITRKEAQEFYNQYFETFKGVADYLKQVKEQALKDGYTKTFFGRIRYFEGITSKVPFIRAMAERMAVNAPVQGTSADILKIAMVKIDEYIIKNKLEDNIKMLLQVHDELIFEIKKDVDAKDVSEIKKIMESVLPINKTKGIVFKVNVKKGSKWNNLVEII